MDGERSSSNRVRRTPYVSPYPHPNASGRHTFAQDAFNHTPPNIRHVAHHPSFHPELSVQPLSSSLDYRGHSQFPAFQSSTRGFATSLDRSLLPEIPEVVVHEGFIPAPGLDEEDEFESANVRDQRQQYGSEDGVTDSESGLSEDEERLNQEIEDKNDDVERDADFDIDENDIEEDPDDLLLEEDADGSDDERPKRVRSSGRGRGRGRPGRRGRPSSRGRGGSLGSIPARAKKKGTPGRAKGKRGPMAVADPGPIFKSLQKKANDAFLQRDYEVAVKYAQEAVARNPEIFAAHSLLSEIYAEMGQEQMSLEALVLGAPTKRDKMLWFHIIDRVKEIDPATHPNFTNSNKTGIVLDCLRAIILLDPDDYEARWQKLEIEAQLGRVSSSVKQCRRMLTIRPYDKTVLALMAKLGTSSQKQANIHLPRIIACFETSISYFIRHDTPGDSNFDWSLLNIYIDLLDRNRDYIRGLVKLKTLSRWLQGRSNEDFWERLDDDREFDEDDNPRRAAVPQFTNSTKDPNKYTLPTELRAKLGLFRLRQTSNGIEEALLHLNLLDPEDTGPGSAVEEFPDIFCAVADTFHSLGYDKEAIRFYEPLQAVSPQSMNLQNYIGMFTAYKTLGSSEKAEALIPTLRDWDAGSMKELAVLAKFFEDIGLDDEAMTRGEAVYRNGGVRLLMRVGMKGVAVLQEFFFRQRKAARGKYGVRKSRISKYSRILRGATGNEDLEDDANVTTTLGPMDKRPGSGMFRTHKSLDLRPKAFLPDDIPGTNLSVDSIDREAFKHRIHVLATENPEELKAAQAQHREIVSSFKRLDEIVQAAEDGDDDALNEFLSVARELIEEFSTFDLFYFDRKHGFTGYFRQLPSGDLWKEAALMVVAVADNVKNDTGREVEIKPKQDPPPEEFYGIHFDRWFDTFAQYAIFLAQRGDIDRCFNTIEVAAQSVIFYRSAKYLPQLQACRLACAMMLDNSRQAAKAVRYFMKEYPFGHEFFRLHSSIQRLCSVPNGFATGPTLKVLLRYIKTMDFALVPAERRKLFSFKGNDHANWQSTAVLTESVRFVKDHDPALFALHGHVLMCGGSSISALNYYFRAYALMPEDATLNLSIGLAYIQHGLKRMSENRQFQIQQGLAFVIRYHDLRMQADSAMARSEAAFNLGRVWHMLGLLSQAESAYQTCVQLSNSARAGEGRSSRHCSADNFATEAAFALQQIYALSCNYSSASYVTREVLII